MARSLNLYSVCIEVQVKRNAKPKSARVNKRKFQLFNQKAKQSCPQHGVLLRNI